MKILDLIKKRISYFVRPELNIQSQMANVIILSGLIAAVPAVLCSAIIGTVGIGIWSEIIMTATVILFLWYLNAKNPSNFFIALFLLAVNAVVFPMMFFNCGGRSTGMVLWMLIGSTFSFLLLTGWYRWVSFVLDVAAFSGCLIVERLHPELVEELDSEVSQIHDIILAFIFVTLILGAVFMLQSILYERQRKELTQKEEELSLVNSELEKASQAKSDFLANMSHEIRTPINAILGMDEMIKRDAKDPIILDYAKDIDSAGKQLLSLVNDILDFSKIESGKFELSPEEYDMYSIVNDCYNMEIGRANDKKLKLIVTNNPNIPARLYGDEIRIRQIAINFLTNAIKYTEKGTVTLKFDMEEVDSEHINLIISVTDTGIGIDENNLNKLFKMFSRVDEKLHRDIEGTGLGLAISQQLTELMHGNISVESKLGEGSTFTVSIPQEIRNSAPMGEYGRKNELNAKTKSSYKQSFVAENASILIVDDVRVNLNVVKLLLRDTKVQMDLAESGKEAIEYIRRKHYDLVLMDHMMPEMDGIETLKCLRSMNGNENQFVPVIALTANALQGAEKMYIASGFCDYLTKPVRAPELEASLIKYLPPELVTITNR